MYVPTGLELDRGADLLDREARRDRNPEPAHRDQVGDLLQGAGGAPAPLAGVTPSIWAAMVQMRPSGTPTFRAACTVSVPCGSILDAGRVVGDLRPDVTAEDIAAALVGIFTVAPRPAREANACRLLDLLLDLLMDGLRCGSRESG